MTLVERQGPGRVRGLLRPPRRRRLLARPPDRRRPGARRGRDPGGVPLDLAQRRPLRPRPRQRPRVDARDRPQPGDRRAAPRLAARRRSSTSTTSRCSRASRPASCTDAEAIRRETARARPRRAAASCPREQSKVIGLAYFGGFSHSEIAEMLGMPLGTVKGRMRLGLEKIRVTLAEGMPDRGRPGGAAVSDAPEPTCTSAAATTSPPTRSARSSEPRPTRARAPPRGLRGLPRAAALAAAGGRPAAALGRAARAAAAAARAPDGDRAGRGARRRRRAGSTAAEPRAGAAGGPAAGGRRPRSRPRSLLVAGVAAGYLLAPSRASRRSVVTARPSPTAPATVAGTLERQDGSAILHVARAAGAPRRRGLRGLGAARRHASSPRACSCLGATGPPRPRSRGRSTAPTRCWSPASRAAAASSRPRRRCCRRPL